MEKEFQHIFRTAASYMSLTKLSDGTVIDVSDSYLEVIGIARDEVLGKRVSDLGVWVDIEERAKIVAEVRGGGQVRGRSVKVRSKDDRVLTCLLFANRVEFDGMECLLVEAIDTTDLEEAKQALVDSESRFENLLEHVPLGIQGYGPDGKIFYWNKKSEEIYGYSADEALGKNLSDLIIPPEVKPDYERGMKLAAALKKSGEFLPAGEVTLKRKDGSAVVVHSIHTAVVSEGKPPTLFCIDMDLSDRKRVEEELSESEARFRSLFESMGELLVLHEMAFDAEGKAVDYRILDCNKAFSKATGIPREKARGALASELYGQVPPPYIDIYSKVFSTGEKVDFDTYFEPMKKHFKISAFRFGPARFATVALDTTDRVEHENALKAKMAEVEKLNRFMMGRETRVIELKREINDLLKEFGKPARYNV